MVGRQNSVGNKSLEFESRVESRVIDVEFRVESSHFVQTTLVKLSLFIPRLESFQHSIATVLIIAIDSCNIV